MTTDNAIEILDGHIKDAIKDYDIENIFTFMASFSSMSRRSSWFAAEVFHTIREKRLELGLWDNWYDIVSENTGYNPVVIRRYADLYDVYLSLPGEYAEKVKILGVGRAVPLIALHKRGLLTESVLDLILEHPDRINDIAREVKGDIRNTDVLGIYMNKAGMLYAVQGDIKNKPAVIKIGVIDVTLSASNPIAKKAISRIIKKASIKSM